MSKEEIIAKKEQENADLRAENHSQKTEISQLRHELDWLKNQLFGQRRERFVPDNPEQLALELGLEPPAAIQEPESEQISYERTKPKVKPSGRQPWPAHIERKEIRLEPTEDLTDLLEIGQDRTEELDYQAAKLTVRVLVRPRYVRKRSKAQIPDILETFERVKGQLREGERIAQIQSTPILQAPMPTRPLPTRPLPKASVATRLLVAIICDKYLDHLPLYRQMKRFERLGVKIPKSTLSNWVMSVGKLLMPLFEAHQAEIFKAIYLQVDETRIQVLNPIKVLPKDRKKTRPGHRRSNPPPKAKVIEDIIGSMEPALSLSKGPNQQIGPV